MLAAWGAKALEMGARRIVFGAMDMVLALLPDPAAKRRESYRLHEWLLARELTGLITVKAGGDEESSFGPAAVRLHAIHGGLRRSPQLSLRAGRITTQSASAKVSR
jgi:KaiC/GvpD/RAD55 family RecA-like ATPase